MLELNNPSFKLNQNPLETRGFNDLKKTGLLGEDPVKSSADKNSFQRILAKSSHGNVDKSVESGDPPPVKRSDPEKSVARPRESNRERNSEASNDSKREAAELKQKQTESNKMKAKAQQRNKLFQNFMDSLESETGISAAGFVGALAEVGANNPDKTPEETFGLVVDRMDLPKEQEEAVKLQYAGFLMNLQKLDQAQQKSDFIVGKPELTQSPEMVKRFEANQMQKGALNSSVQKLNQQFWMQDKVAMGQPGLQAELPSGSEVPVAGRAVSDFGSSLNAQEFTTNVPSDLPPQMGGLRPVGQAAAQGQLNPQLVENKGQKELLEELIEREQMQSSNGASSETEMVAEDAESMSGLLPAAAVKSASAAPLVKMNELTYTAPNIASKMPMAPMTAMSSGSSGQMGGGDSSFGSESSSSGKKELSETKIRSMDANAELMASQGEMKSAALDPLTTPKEASAALGASRNGHQQIDEKASIQKIMNQADYLVKNGGGEMKVEMNPEGMGQVHLKVLVNEGKVNIQMATDNQDVKKMIESNISDLKNQLHGQKLSIEHVKVDVVQSMNTDNNSQGNMNMNSQHRDNPKPFWNQFQENFGNRSQREGYSDLSDTQRFGPRSASPLSPLLSGASSGQRKFENKGQGLNLVA